MQKRTLAFRNIKTTKKNHRSVHALLSASAYNAAETRLKKSEAINEYLLYGNLKVFEKLESIEKI